MSRGTVETLSETSEELRKLSAQFICPKDTFFASMADKVDKAESAIGQVCKTGSKGFVTCDSSPDERYAVVAKFRTLKDAQEFHSALCDLGAVELQTV